MCRQENTGKSSRGKYTSEKPTLHPTEIKVTALPTMIAALPSQICLAMHPPPPKTTPLPNPSSHLPRMKVWKSGCVKLTQDTAPARPACTCQSEQQSLPVHPVDGVGHYGLAAVCIVPSPGAGAGLPCVAPE